MEWDQITERWARMALRLRNDKTAPAQTIAGTQDAPPAAGHRNTVNFETTAPAASGTDRSVQSNP